jgi:hypothetical protein
MGLMGRRKQLTLQQAAAKNVGQVKGAKVVAFIVMWGIAEEALGHPPTLEEYATWWRESRSTVFRLQARFRDAFPGESTPQRLVDALREQEGPNWFKRGVSACTSLALRGDAVLEVLTPRPVAEGELA